MCINPSKLSLCSPLNIAVQPSKRHRLHRRLNRRRWFSKQAKEKRMKFTKTAIEIKNMKLYMQNRSIIEENEKLRKQAFLLHQENQALLSQLQRKFSNAHDRYLAHNSSNGH